MTDLPPYDFDTLLTTRGINSIRGIGNIGHRVFGGRIARTVASTVTPGRTYEVLMAPAQHFDAIRVILAVSQTAALDAITPTVQVGLAVVPDTTDASLVAATPIPALFAGAATTTLAPAVTSSRRTIVTTDWTVISSVPRTDGGSLPLLVIRACVVGATTGNVVMLGNGAQNFSNWATHPSGRIWRMNGKGGQFVLGANWTGMQNSNSIAEQGCVIVGMQGLYRGKVINIDGFGDSISEGQGTYIGEGFGHPAAVALTAADSNGVVYEWSNWGWAGQSMSQIRDNLLDALASGIIGAKDIITIPNASPNDISTTISAANILAIRGKLGTALQKIAANGIETLQWTWLPSNTSIKTYAATDSLRRAYNDETRLLASRGQIIVDLASVIAGIDDGTGQIQIKATPTNLTTDGIHPNDAGNALLTVALQNAIKKIVGTQPGSLITS